MDKTELMKRYEAETGEKAKKKVLVMYSTKRYGWGREKNHLFFTNKFVKWFKGKYDALKAENAKLKAQLTWRPASEKPTIETEEVLIRKEQRFNGKNIVTIQPIKMNTIGDWGQYVAKLGVDLWIPIPPAPGGEVK